MTFYFTGPSPSFQTEKNSYQDMHGNGVLSSFLHAVLIQFLSRNSSALFDIHLIYRESLNWSLDLKIFTS